MAKNYTAAEIEAAVRKLVLGTVRRPYGVLGNRELNVEFNDLQDAAAGVFVTTPAAPFYVIALGARRVEDAERLETAQVEELLEAISATGRQAPPVKSVSALANAQTALGALSSAAQARAGAFEDLTSVPAYKRYVDNTDKFLRTAALSVRANGAIVQTPQEARRSLAEQLAGLVSAHTALLARVRYLAGAQEDYAKLNLAGLLSAGVIERARQVLQGRVEELTGLSEEERNQVMRDVTLDVLAGRAAVAGFSSLATSSTFVPLEGTGAVFADAAHLADAASLASSKQGPFAILAAQAQITLRVDASVDLTIALPASFLAELSGVVDEPYTIYGSSPPPGTLRNDHIVVSATGYSDLNYRLTAGVARSASSLAAELNAAVTTQPLEFEARMRREQYSGPAKLTATGATHSGGLDITFLITGQSWAALGVQVGSLVVVRDPSSLNHLGEYLVESFTTTVLQCSHAAGPAAMDDLDALIEVGPSARHLRIRIKDSAASAALAVNLALTLPAGISDPAYSTLGFVESSSLACQKTTTSAVVAAVNSSFGASLGGVPRLQAAAYFQVLRALRGRTDAYDAFLLALYVLRGTVSHPAGTSVLLTLGAVLDGALASVTVGMRVVIRETGTAADLGKVGTVTARSAVGFTASFPGGLSASTTTLVEVAPTGLLAVDRTVRVGEGLNAGDYRVTAVGAFPGDATVERAVPFRLGLGGQPYLLDAAVGQFGISFLSLARDLSTRVEVLPGGCATQFFTTVPSSAVGSTPFVRLPNAEGGIDLDDQLEICDTHYNVPTLVSAVVGLELSQRLIEVSPALPTDRTSLLFSLQAPVPFARIRNTQANNYEDLRVALEGWLALPENQPAFLAELSRSINPLISNANPTATAVSTARTQLLRLAGVLSAASSAAAGKNPALALDSLLGGYSATPVPSVDALVTSFRQKGADRALDLLLAGRFQAFFGLGQDNVSYLGEVLTRIREVQSKDLPVSKLQRQNDPSSMLRASYEEPDAEFDLSDTQDLAEPDIPGMFPEGGPGAAY